jgi:hypothetical protein
MICRFIKCGLQERGRWEEEEEGWPRVGGALAVVQKERFCEPREMLENSHRQNRFLGLAVSSRDGSPG